MAKPKEKDRLEEALSKKYETVQLSERSITLQKWTLRQGLRHSATLLQILLRLAGKAQDVQSLLQSNVADLLSQNEADLEAVINIMADTVCTGNAGWLTSSVMAKEFVEGLAPDEFIALLMPVLRMNVRPLVQRLGEAKAESQFLMGAKAQ